MINITNACRNSSALTCFIVQSRSKTKTHWSKVNNKNSPKMKALAHFDDFYGSVFGDKWERMRDGLLRKSKYVAVVNNYGDPDETTEFLTNKGAHCLNKLITVQNNYNKEYLPPKPTLHTENISNKILEEYSARLSSEEVGKIYPQGQESPNKLDFNEDAVVKDSTKVAQSVISHEIKLSTDKNSKKALDMNKNSLNCKPQTYSVTTNKSLDESLRAAEIDESRIIDPSLGVTADQLYQYIPATKLKGMENWISESEHYAYHSKAKDFPLLIEPDSELDYPEHLKVFTYEKDSEWTMFPEPKRCTTGVFNYYAMDCGSVLAVLALGLRPGERVLDLCSAPGGKALVALQTLLPDVIVCNDVSLSRYNRIHKIFTEYFFDFASSNKWRERVVLTNIDGRDFTDDNGFDKVLVDVPCTIDRHSLNKEGNNIFRPDRIRERLRLPELQTQLLVNALRLSRVGGTVVYSTCSLSPVQNDGVVHNALKHAFEGHGVVATIRDMSSSMSALSSTVNLCEGPAAPKYGQLIVPDVSANFGPTYIAKMIRVK